MRVIPLLLSVYYNRTRRKTTLVTFCFDKMFLLMCVVEARSYSITLTFHGSVHLIVVRVSDRIEGANADHGGFKCIVEFRKGSL